MHATLWAAFIMILAYLVGREVLSLGEARRSSRLAPEDYRRFRRRVLGIAVLFLLGFVYDLGRNFPFAEPRHELWYYGVCFILLIWLLIIAARDMKEIADGYVRDKQEVALQALVEMEERFRRRRDPDNQPIPPLDFSAGTAGDQSPQDPATDSSPESRQP